MESAQNQFLSALKAANNVMVTVKSDPSIDGLAAAIALTLLLNGLNKHATAVFSGTVPSVLEFLEPQKTLEVNTNSLQDFIISLDKSKADKLRYKVEDDVVKVFITPYRTSLSPADLEFSQGDFNVDVVVLLGVQAQSELDAAVSAHGRILHDATVLSVNVGSRESEKDDLGAINWNDEHVSSLSELIVSVADELLGDKKDVLDNQVATALLTGIVSATDRFGNSKTTPGTLQAAARLLQAGANQELVSTKLASTGPTTQLMAVDDTANDANGSGEVLSLPLAAMITEDGTQDFAEDTGGTQLIDHDEPTAEFEADADIIAIEPAVPVEPDEPVQSVEPDVDLNPVPDELAADGISEVHHSDLVDTPILDMAAAAEADIAAQTQKAFDMNQISVPASVPISENEQTAIEHASTPEEDALLAMLNQGAPATTPQAEGVQPLRDQNVFLGEPPLHEKKMNPLAMAQSGSVDTSLDATKFAVTPPQFAGTLTAAYDDSEAAPSDPLSTPQTPQIVRHRALMTQDPHSQAVPTAPTAQAGSVDVQPGDSEGEGDAPHSPGQVLAPVIPDADKPVTMSHERVLSVPTHGPVETEQPASTETMSELERLIGIQHADPAPTHDGPRQALQAALAAADAAEQSAQAPTMPAMQSMNMPYPNAPVGGMTPVTFSPTPPMPAASVPPPAPPPMPMFGGPAA